MKRCLFKAIRYGKPVLVLLGVITLNCGWGKDDQKQNLQIPPHELKLQEFFSETNRGKWHDLPDEHSPTVNIIKNKKNISVVVLAPFSGTPAHYVETIILADYAVKELQKTTFGRGETATNTIFTLPLGTHGEFYVLLKCNLHDMWYKKILIQ